MPMIETERYEIDPQPIGRGGFGEAYAAHDLLFQRDVVIKTIAASRLYGIDEPRFRHQFFREALVAARLGSKSQHIVRVLDFGYDRTTDLPFFVMEKVTGGDLRDKIGSFSWHSAAVLLEHLFDALSVAHANGVIHSDVSPDNILFDAQQDIYKLNDFGLAKLLNSMLMSRGASLSLTGGKPGYLPVEHLDSGDRNEYTDLYGTAMTIINLVTGTIPRWRFDFASNQMVGPDLANLLITDNPDEVVISGSRESSIFTVECPLSGGWTIQRQGYSRSKHLATFRATDLTALLSRILGRELSTIQEVRNFIRERTLDHLLPIERNLRAEAEKNHVAAKSRRNEARRLQSNGSSENESDDKDRSNAAANESVNEIPQQNDIMRGDDRLFGGDDNDTVFGTSAE